MASTTAFAGSPVLHTDEEASNTDRAREQYFEMRRMHPPGSSVAALRLQAYQAAAASSKAPSTINIIKQVLNNESWQSIGPSAISGGQTPTSATAQSRSYVSGRATTIAIDPQDGPPGFPATGVVYVGGAQGGIWKSYDNGASWTPLTDNLGSLAVGTIVVAPGTHASGAATLYFGTGEGNFSGDGYAGVGIYKSTDSGQTWQGPFGSNTSQFLGRAVDAIAPDRANPNHVLAGSSFGLYGISGALPPTYGAVGIFVSNDGGQTWTSTFTTSPATPSFGFVSRIVQDPTTATTWWAAMAISNQVGGALIKSTDNGATWAKVDGVAAGLPAIDASNTGVNGGFVRAWISTSTASGKTVLYLGTSEIPVSQQSTNNFGGKLYVSLDGGATWANQTAADGYCQGQCFYDMPVYTPPESATTVYTGGAGNSGSALNGGSSFMVSANSGASFTDEMVAVDGNSALHADIHAIVTWPGQPNNLWVGNDGGVFHSTDGGQHWQSVNTNLQLTQFQGCDLHPTDPTLAYGGTQDNGTESYLGASVWSHSDDGDGGFALIDQGNPANVTHTYYNIGGSQVLAVTAANGVASQPADYQGAAGYLSGGAGNPPQLNNGIGATDSVLFYAPMALDPGVADTLYFGTDHLYIAPQFFKNALIAAQDAFPASGTPNPNYPVFTALNGGATLAPPIPPSTSASGPVSAIWPVRSFAGSANTIYVGTSSGLLWKSTNSGATFTQIDTTAPTSGVPAVQEYVSSIVTDPRNPNIVVVSRAGFTGSVPAQNVRISLDGGNTWSNASNGLPDIPVNAVAFDPVFPNQLWAGTDIGAYLSTNGGANWVPFNQGFPNVAVFSLATNQLTHKVLACTHGRGAFELTIAPDEIFTDGFEGR
ncbi:MAG: WD40/YVTN/BNR-like repeat-containing protein [Rudaea sp.]